MRKDIFIFKSCSLSSNVIDWIRSIYFSLFGSSMLAMIMKISTFNLNTSIFFTLGVLCFMIGLFNSLKIANRFKNYEKVYDTKPLEYKKGKALSLYYLEKEKEGEKSLFCKSIQHFIFFFIWIPALIFVGIAGYTIETKSSNSSKLVNDKLDTIEKNIILNKKIILLIDSLEKSNKILNESKFEKTKIIDSLTKVIKKKK